MRARHFCPAVAVSILVLGGCDTMKNVFSAKEFVETPVAARTDDPPLNQTPGLESPGRPGVKPAPIPPQSDPADLIGRSEDGVRAVLGKPSAVTDASPATIWRYAGNGCALDVFFYMDIGTNTKRALTYDVKSTDTAPDRTERCVQSIRVAKNVSKT